MCRHCRSDSGCSWPIPCCWVCRPGWRWSTRAGSANQWWSCSRLRWTAHPGPDPPRRLGAGNGCRPGLPQLRQQPRQRRLLLPRLSQCVVDTTLTTEPSSFAECSHIQSSPRRTRSSPSRRSTVRHASSSSTCSRGDSPGDSSTTCCHSRRPRAPKSGVRVTLLRVSVSVTAGVTAPDSCRSARLRSRYRRCRSAFVKATVRLQTWARGEMRGLGTRIPSGAGASDRDRPFPRPAETHHSKAGLNRTLSGLVPRSWLQSRPQVGQGLGGAAPRVPWAGRMSCGSTG